MSNKIELLAPGGDVDSIKAAIVAGADAIYCGLDKFNARNRATNISFDDLHGILRLAHKNECEIFVTLNIIILETETPALMALLNKLVNTGIDGIIVQDFGMLYLVSTYFPSLKVHASTQLTTHNEGQIKFLNKLGVTRVNLCRELNINEIRNLTTAAHTHDMMTEVFVHGSNCISFSGLCYISSVQSGNSGNRGRCSQTCRNQFNTTSAGKSYPLNLKDNSAFSNLVELAEAGVDSLKIEGRIKKFDYVYTVVNSWRSHIDRYNKLGKSIEGAGTLKKVFNRDHSNGFLTGEVSKDLFIDNPRDNSAKNLAKSLGDLSSQGVDKARDQINDFRAKIMTEVKEKVSQLSIKKSPLALQVSGVSGEPLKITVKTDESTADFFSQCKLQQVKSKGLDYDSVYLKLKAINETGYIIGELNLENLEKDLTIPFKELTVIRKQIIFKLNGSRETVAPIELPKLKSTYEKKCPTLSVLISSVDDLHLCDQTTAKLYFKLPDSIDNRLEACVDIFKQNPNVTPWFPAVLIGDDYKTAVALLNQVNPPLIVTNNTGIAYEAWKKGINWIAGPELNTINSYSLICLKEQFNCVGAFVSNELNKSQLKGIKKPTDFNLFYSIYHPIELMISRQCLFHQASGCHKHKMDQSCLADCQKNDSISNVKNGVLRIQKNAGNYNRVFNDHDFLNTAIINDMPNCFDSLFIDLCEVKTSTKWSTDKFTIIKVFESHLNGNLESPEAPHQIIHPTTQTQYKKGI